MRTAPARGVIVATLAALVALGGCEDEPADPRFASPEATLNTLLASYGVAEMEQEEIIAQMRDRGGFELRDQVAYERCFADYDGPQDEGLAGFVFGTVAAGKDQLRVNRVDDRAHVFPDPERTDRSVVLVEDDGEWRISLRDSVPSNIREALHGEFQRIQERNRRSGLTE